MRTQLAENRKFVSDEFSVPVRFDSAAPGGSRNDFFVSATVWGFGAFEQIDGRTGRTFAAALCSAVPDQRA